MDSVRYGTSHFHQFTLYKFSINLTIKVSLLDHFWTRILVGGTSSPALTPILMRETYKRNSGNSSRTSVGEFHLLNGTMCTKTTL